jgi:pimeloyl-ACP methyl ester carboxylesterase
MSRIFLIAGLGADTRVYNNIDLNAHEVICVDWVEPNKMDTLASYSQRLIYQYHIQPNSIVIGNSLGGMIAVEIAKIIPLEKVILISSIKTVDEEPAYFSFFRMFPVYKIVPGKAFTSMGFMIRFMFGKMSAADSWLFNDMLKNSSPVFVKWAMGAALHWDNTIIPPNIYQITGDKDRIFSYKRIKNAITIKGGTHIMIFDRAKEINRLLKKILKK